MFFLARKQCLTLSIAAASLTSRHPPSCSALSQNRRNRPGSFPIFDLIPWTISLAIALFSRQHALLYLWQFWSIRRRNSLFPGNFWIGLPFPHKTSNGSSATIIFCFFCSFFRFLALENRSMRNTSYAIMFSLLKFVEATTIIDIKWKNRNQGEWVTRQWNLRWWTYSSIRGRGIVDVCYCEFCDEPIGEPMKRNLSTCPIDYFARQVKVTNWSSIQRCCWIFTVTFVIHLFEANYNWLIGMIFGRRIVHVAETQDYLPSILVTAFYCYTLFLASSSNSSDPGLQIPWRLDCWGVSGIVGIFV